MTIDKSQILKITKPNTAATIGIVAGGIVAIIIVPSYIRNEPVGGR